MLLVVLLLVSKAGAVCVGGTQELRTGEVMVMCPLSEDVRLMKLDVVISHFSNHDQRIPDTMLGCVWPERDSPKHDCRSRFNFTLASLQKDCVMARMPRAQLQKDGFYQCELVPPPDADHAFSRCLVLDNGADGGSPRGNSAADVTLSVSVVILTVLIVGLFAYIILLHRKYGRRRWTSRNSLEMEKQPMNGTTPTV